MVLSKLKAFLKLEEPRKYRIYNDFKEELSEFIEYLSKEKPKNHESFLEELKVLDQMLIFKPTLPLTIEEQIARCCNEMIKEKGKERFEIYGYCRYRTEILTTEKLEESGIIISRSNIGVRIDEKKFLMALEIMKKENMTTLWHHTHNDLSWPSRRDFDIMMDYSEYLDLGVVSRFGFGTAYIDTKKVKETPWDLINILNNLNFYLGAHLVNFYKPLKPPPSIIARYNEFGI